MIKSSTIGAVLAFTVTLIGAQAQVRVVEDGVTTSVHHSIQEAIDFAPAAAKVVVPSGTYYGGFTIDRPVVVKGSAHADVPVVVHGLVRIEWVTAEEPVALSSMWIETLEVASTTSCVVLDRLELFGDSPCMHLTGSTDVRAFKVRSDVRPGLFATGTWWVQSSRLEATDCQVFTQRASWGMPGTPGIFSEGSFLHLANCSVFGGSGGDESLHETFPLPPSDGAPAVFTVGGSGTRITNSYLSGSDGGRFSTGVSGGLLGACIKTVGGLHELYDCDFAGPSGAPFRDHDATSTIDMTTACPMLLLIHPPRAGMPFYLEVYGGYCHGTSVHLKMSPQPRSPLLTGARVPGLCGSGPTVLMSPYTPMGDYYDPAIPGPSGSPDVVFLQVLNSTAGLPLDHSNSIAFVP